MFAIAPTDHEWFANLRSEPPARIVNFWTPTPWKVKGLHEGDRLYFMLKAPIRLVGGYGTFVRYTEMTASEAWVTYGLGNGVAGKDELVNKIAAFAARRSTNSSSSGDSPIGCIELADVVALDDNHFIDPAAYGHAFPNEVVKLKYFHEADGIAASLRTERPAAPFVLIDGAIDRASCLRKNRKGQSLFRQSILRNYDYRCCVYGETIVELLEAAHIQPYINEHSNHPQNGLCLRVDLHRLFDEGLISITNRHTIAVSKRLRSTSYAALDGQAIALPMDPSAHPSAGALALHRATFR